MPLSSLTFYCQSMCEVLLSVDPVRPSCLLCFGSFYDVCPYCASACVCGVCVYYSLILPTLSLSLFLILSLFLLSLSSSSLSLCLSVYLILSVPYSICIFVLSAF